MSGPIVQQLIRSPPQYLLWFDLLLILVLQECCKCLCKHKHVKSNLMLQIFGNSIFKTDDLIFLCCAFVRDCLFVPCGHLLGKG